MAEETDLFIIVQDVLDRTSAAAGERGIHVSFDGEEAWINGIRRILDEMVYNLMDNVVKYNRDGGEIRVALEKTGSAETERAAVLSITDTGIGIPFAEQERVFERFYRIDKSRSKATGGTGLGLSIVKHGAALHGAKLEVRSDGKTGSCFRLTFPV